MKKQSSDPTQTIDGGFHASAVGNSGRGAGCVEGLTSISGVAARDSFEHPTPTEMNELLDRLRPVALNAWRVVLGFTFFTHGGQKLFG